MVNEGWLHSYRSLGQGCPRDLLRVLGLEQQKTFCSYCVPWVWERGEMFALRACVPQFNVLGAQCLTPRVY